MTNTVFNFKDHPHRRYNPLMREWVLVSPHRTKRPWQGQVEATAPEQRPHYDPECYLCPGNQRAGGVHNPNYSSTFVFTNDFASMLPETPEGAWEQGRADAPPLLKAMSQRGTCRVVCFSPRHDLTLSQMEIPDLMRGVTVLAYQYLEIGAQPNLCYIQLFV